MFSTFSRDTNHSTAFSLTFVLTAIAMSAANGSATLAAAEPNFLMKVSPEQSSSLKPKPVIAPMVKQQTGSAKTPVQTAAESQCLKELSNTLSLLQRKAISQADASLSRAVQLAKMHPNTTLSTKFASVLNGYMKYGTASESLAAALKLITMGGDKLFEQIDDDLENMANSQLDNGNLKNAETLMKARIAACKATVQDDRISDWYLRLSEVELTLGNNDESDRLFDQVEKLYTIRDGDADQAMTKRDKILPKSSDTRKLASLHTSGDTFGQKFQLKHGVTAAEIEFGEDTSIQIKDSSENKLIENKLPEPDIYCSGTIHTKGAFKYGGVIQVDTLIPDMALNQAAFKLEKVTPESAPPTIRPVAATPWMPEKADGTLLPGVYMTKSCSAINSGQLSGRNRIFLIDDAKSPDGFDIKSVTPQTEYAYDLQLIYAGVKPIKISDFIGVIYAPNAPVELSGAFSGAIVARKLITSDYARLYFDHNLVARTIHQ